MERFTNLQIEEFHDAFLMFDKQSRGYVLFEQVNDLLRTLGYNPREKLLQKILIDVDEDDNGQMDFHEFVALIDKLETCERNTKEARAAFNAFDFMGRGYVAASDVKAALMFLMEKSSEDDREEILKTFKLNVNRKIYFREFEDMITVRR